MGKAAASAKATPKAMKSTVKATKLKPLPKGKISPKEKALPKGKPKAGAKSSLPKGNGARTLTKQQRANARAKVKKSHLSKGKLAKLGKMSLKEKNRCSS